MAVFPNEKSRSDWKIWEERLFARLSVGQVAVAPLVVKSCRFDELDRSVDARITLGLEDETSEYPFVVESKAQSTPLSVRNAMARAKAAAKKGENPLIVVPYLSEERLRELEQQKVSGMDYCGNGFVIVPRRFYIMRGGQPNRYPDSRPLNKPFSGRSALVARVLLMRSEWSSLNEVASALKEQGALLSLPQVSKAVKAMVEEVAILKEGPKIMVFDKQVLIDRLAFGWRKPRFLRQQAFRLESGDDWSKRLSEMPNLRWAVTGESSVKRYVTFSEAGPLRIAVSNLGAAANAIDGKTERWTNFAQIELLETDEVGFYFQNEIDETGIRWASQLQTWLELQSGDARQRDAARDLRPELLSGKP